MRFPSRQRTDSTHARQSFSAGVQTMRARICSAFSCDMFARVVWLKLRRVRHCCFPLCPLPHALATHYFLRLTRARGKSSQREGNALFDDFWYFWSRKSTRKEKLLYDSLRRQQATALRTKPKHNQQTKQKCALHPVSARAKFTPAYLFLAGVQAMRARICSALSCDMFARVV